MGGRRIGVARWAVGALSTLRSSTTQAGAMATHHCARPACSLSSGSSSFSAGVARLPCARAPRVATSRAARRAVSVTAKVQGNIKKARTLQLAASRRVWPRAPRARSCCCVRKLGRCFGAARCATQLVAQRGRSARHARFRVPGLALFAVLTLRSLPASRWYWPTRAAWTHPSFSSG